MSYYKIRKIYSTANTKKIVEWDLEQTPHDTLSGTGATSHLGIDSHIDTSDIHFPWSDVEDAIGDASFTPPFYVYESAAEEASTTTESWINRLTLTASGVEPGRYRLAWYWEWRISKTNKTHSVRIVLNDDYVNLLAETDASMIQTTNWLSTSGFYHATLSSGTYHIDMDWMIDDNGGGTVGYIRRSRLEFWKVGD